MADSSIDIGNIKVAVSDLETGTDGEMITWDSSGNPATVAVGTATHVLTSNGVGLAPTFQAPSGIVLQEQYAEILTTASGTTSIPQDDTIPQSSEGTEQVTVSITPANTNNILLIELFWMGANSSVSRGMIMALFQDSTANALTAVSGGAGTAGGQFNIYMSYRMTAGTVSSTTFKMRFGNDGTGTWRRNQIATGTRVFGGVATTWIKATEIEV